MSKAKLKTIGVLVAVFLLGGIAGGAGMRAYMNRDLSADMDGEPADARRRLRLRAMARRLDLSPEQRAKIEQILERRLPERQEIQQSIRPDLQAWQREVKEEIAAVLTPEQRAQYDRYEQQRQQPKPPQPRRWRRRQGQQP